MTNAEFDKLQLRIIELNADSRRLAKQLRELTDENIVVMELAQKAIARAKLPL